MAREALDRWNQCLVTAGREPAAQIVDDFERVLGLKDIDGKCSGYIVIGRRSTLIPRQVKAYRALSADGITVMSYDRLLDHMKRVAR
jgi:hypothetical protein